MSTDQQRDSGISPEEQQREIEGRALEELGHNDNAGRRSRGRCGMITAIRASTKPARMRRLQGIG